MKDSPDLLTQLHAMADTALTQFADYGEEEDPAQSQKKKKGMGGALAATAAAGAGAVGVNRAVMNNARSQGPVQGAGAAYRTAGADIQRNVTDAASKVGQRWKNPRANNRFVSPTLGNKLKSAGGEVLKQGGQLIRKIVRTVTHYDDPTTAILTQLNEQADEALVKFGAFVPESQGEKGYDPQKDFWSERNNNKRKALVGIPLAVGAAAALHLAGKRGGGVKFPSRVKPSARSVRSVRDVGVEMA